MHLRINLDVRLIIAMNYKPEDMHWIELHDIKDLLSIPLVPLLERVEEAPLLINELTLRLVSGKICSIRFTTFHFDAIVGLATSVN